jgi:dolichol-phosphate mannosyltransferase
MGVIERMPADVAAIYCVDDGCPDGSGDFIEQHAVDPRVRVIRRERNGGVGAAVCSGYVAALRDDMDICVKIDGDGQMDPGAIDVLILPILERRADYAKANRFFNVEDVRSMPVGRVLGNVALSFFTKLSSGYWDVFDPTNGFTAIHARVLERIPLEKLHSRYFFESDLLFRLGCIGARVYDVPMPAIYGDEISNLKISRIFMPFLLGNLRNLVKRIVYSYYLRDFSLASIYLIASVLLLLGGAGFGAYFWLHGIALGRAATPGQVMFAALPLVFGIQLALSFISSDIARTPRSAIHVYLPAMRRHDRQG